MSGESELRVLVIASTAADEFGNAPSSPRATLHRLSHSPGPGGGSAETLYTSWTARWSHP